MPFKIGAGEICSNNLYTLVCDMEVGILQCFTFGEL